MDRVESRESSRRFAVAKVESRKAEGGRRRAEGQTNPQPPAPSPRPRPPRRGVLLLVVLSMLVLFMLIGTAFLMSSGQSRDSAKILAKKERLETHATGLLERAAMALLRDTENPVSAAHTHSLLRDFYGTDGFQGLVYQPTTIDFTATNGSGQTTRYAGSFAATPLGPTQGQFIDIYVGSVIPNTGDTPELKHTLKLDRNVLGQPQAITLPLTKGYYNGCLLTVTSGSAAGQSTRILDYEFVGQFNAPTPPTPPRTMRLFRFRVMAFGRSDGGSLQVSTTRSPELSDLASASFIVNGRPFNGTGVGYNPLAATGQARLTALQQLNDGTNYVGAEVALTPNARYLDFARVGIVDPTVVPNPFVPGLADTDFLPLNDPTLAAALWPTLWRYQTYSGPGDADEGYDAADFQNIWLALQTVTPREQGRVVVGQGTTQQTITADEFLNNPQVAAFLRLDLEDVPLPSFHRPDLVNFWYHRLLLLIANGSPITDDQVRALFQPYQTDGTPTAPLTAEQAYLITAIKRKIMMRPIREDHPNFDGGNPQSKFDYNSIIRKQFVRNGNIAIPYWEVVGPWDVDNDNDGVPDSVWIDLGDPVQELEDGTRVKALYATLIIDLDSRLNVNAHGLADHINPNLSNLAYVQYVMPNGTLGPLVQGPNLAGDGTVSSNILPQGVGMGPPEISLRPIFPKPTVAAAIGNRAEMPNTEIDSYATLIAGRRTSDDTAISGKYGYLQIMTDQQKVAPGYNYDFNAPGWQDTNSPTGDTAKPDLAAQLKFFDYPWVISQRSAFGTPPDLFGRYALGLDYSGQPYYEVLNDLNPATQPLAPAEWRYNHLLVNSPYEINLSDSQRRETSSAQYADAASAFSSSLVQNDDAPFSVTDLERVLRAWDADSGTLPSRLWDVVDAFDPLKLHEFDRYRVTGKANELFDPVNQGISPTAAGDYPQRLAAAQQMAGINRRLVTTDSFNPPVPSITPPAYLLTVPDVVASDPNIPLLGKQLYLQAANRKPPNSMAEMLELRIRRAHAGDTPPWPPTPFDDYDPNGDHDLDGQLNSVDSDYNLPNATAAQNARLARAAQINTIIQQLLAPELLAGKRMDLNRPFGDGRDNAGNGIDDNNNGRIDEPAEQTDGTDPFNMANGVVDDPMEAGDPFLDVDGNGKWTVGEPFINLDGSVDTSDDPTYTPPRDLLWADLTAQNVMAESIAFDYTNGFGYPIHPVVATALGIPPSALPNVKVRNLESQARQVYARHLYCLMLMLVDENYIAPWDGNDPQIRELLDASDSKSQVSVIKAALDASASPPADTAQEARRIVLRKLTIRAIAQWAVNCADMRDADAIMTPFEYDENPWDGWGVMGRDGNLISLDGDLATDENGDLTTGLSNVLDWATILTNAAKATTTVPAPQNALGQTRGLVWGAERPELLITETIGLHDRRTEDTGTDFTLKTLEQEPQNDDDLDQRLRPKGSVFIELYNPWSPTGQYPAEIYSLFDTKNGGFVDRNGDMTFDANDVMGVELGRLSTFGAEEITPATTPEKDKRYRLAAGIGGRITRSPIWRMIVVEEHQEYRNNTPLPPPPDGTDDPKNPHKIETWDDGPANVHAQEIAQKLRTGVHSGNLNLPPDWFFTGADPDRVDSFFGQGWPNSGDIPSDKPYIERAIYFTSDNAKRLDKQDADDPSGANENFLSLNPKNIAEKLRLPAQFANAAGSPRSARYFIAPDASKVQDAPGSNNTGIGDVAIAPIKPGRYAVIGTAGVQYDNKRTGAVEDINGQPVNGVPRYVTPISRIDRGGGTGNMETPDDEHLGMLDITRRIEMFPNPNPESQQILVASNGGTPLFPRSPGLPGVARRDNEIVYRPNGTPKFNNIYVGKMDPASATIPFVPDTQLIPPCVAIPIKDMSISEPLDLYVERRRILDEEEVQRSNIDTSDDIQSQSHYYNPEAANGEGSFVNDTNANARQVTAYDTPFDIAPELVRNGTTANYRTIHLQRLADPTLPWNPLPTLPDGSVNPQHDAKLPVNVYRTIDSSSVDLTAFNGTSSREPDEMNPSGTHTALEKARFLPFNTAEFRTMYSKHDPPLPYEHRIHFRSLERGTHAADRIAADGIVQVAARALWRQEPINFHSHLQTWLWIDPNLITPTPKQARFKELAKRANELRLRDREILEADIAAIGDEEDADFKSFPATLKPERPAHFDFIFDHTLGFSNESFGAMISKADLGTNLPVTANGTPSKDGLSPTDPVGEEFPFTRHKNPQIETPVESTYPWLAWGNRPFVSAEELLNVPGTSSSQMLRQYSTIFRTAFNPYDGTGIDLTTGNPLTVGMRLATYLSPYGHLFSAFQTASTPAGVFRDPMGAPILDSTNNWQFIGAPHYYRILEYVQVPSRFVGTDTMLTAEIFNDPVGNDITSPQDPRYSFQPPFNKVSRERDPGQVNLNTVTGRRSVEGGIPRIWSEVFDGIMHRDRDGNQAGQLSHLGPAWRDVVMSRKGYTQLDAGMTPTPTGIGFVEKIAAAAPPDVFMFGLNPNFPSVFSNPFRSSDAGDLVPLQQMVHFGIDASLQRRHHFNRGGRGTWGSNNTDDNANGIVDETREAGFGGDDLVVDSTNGALLPAQPTFPAATAQSGIPLFSESFTAASIDGERNPAFYYQPMTRMENLVTNRSNVFAIWITVGYFEVEPAPNWDDPDDDTREAIRARFGGTLNDTDAATIAGLALYNRVYPDGYMLGREVGSDTGDVRRPRGFYIVDRTEEVGFKPGEDLNVEKTIKLRRRIE